MRLKTIFTTVALAILLGCVILFSTGCQMTSFLQSASGVAVMEHGAVIAGVMVGSNNLDRIDEGVKICDEFLKAENETVKQAALEAATTYIFKKYGQTQQTMVIMAEVQKLAGIFMKDGKLGFLDNYNPEILGKFVLSFRNGLAMATPRHTKFIRQ